MTDTFLRTLKFLEERWLAPQVKNEQDLSVRTKNVLRKLVKFVEQGAFTDSQTEKFILANFRCSAVELTERWNRIYFDRKKSSNTFRSQVSSLNSYLVSLFGISGMELNDAFVTENNDVLRGISDILDAFEVGDFNVATRFPFISQGYLPVEETSSVYSADECEAEIRLLKSLDIKVIDEMVRQVDLDKLVFVVQTIREPLITDIYEKREGKSSKVKVASVNKRKLEFNKKFHLVKPRVLKPVGEIEVADSQTARTDYGSEAGKNTSGVGSQAVVPAEAVVQKENDSLAKPSGSPFGLNITKKMADLIEKRLKVERKPWEMNDTDSSKIGIYKEYLYSLTMNTPIEDLYKWLRSVNAVFLGMALDELKGGN